MPSPSLGCPSSRPDLEINAVADGFIVYQPDRDRIHYLNATAAVVLELCNGRNPVDNLPGLLQLAFDLNEPPLEAVTACLETLSQEGLIA